MEQAIKNRIEQMNAGKVPAGYKKTEVGLAPIEWESTTLSEIFTFKNGLNKEKKAFGEGTLIVNYVDVYKNRSLRAIDLHGKVTLSKKEIENYNVRKGDVFFTRTSETIDEIELTSVMLDDVTDAVFSGFVLRGRPKKRKLFIRYSQYCFSLSLMRREVVEKSSYTTRALTNGALLGQVNINLPRYKEQDRIVATLVKWDRAIYLQEQLVLKYDEQKLSIVQRLFEQYETGRQRLGSHIIQRSIRNNGRTSNVLSVNNKLGFIRQDEQFGKVVASAELSGYKIVSKGDIAFNPSRINVGSIALYDKDDIGIVSPMYVVFSCKATLDPYVLLQMFSLGRVKYEMTSLISGSVRNTLSYDGLCNMRFSIPTVEEQRKARKILDVIDQIRDKQLRKLSLMKEQRNALMQLLLTGIVRVKGDA